MRPPCRLTDSQTVSESARGEKNQLEREQGLTRSPVLEYRSRRVCTNDQDEEELKERKATRRVNKLAPAVKSFSLYRPSYLLLITPFRIRWCRYFRLIQGRHAEQHPEKKKDLNACGAVNSLFRLLSYDSSSSSLGLLSGYTLHFRLNDFIACQSRRWTDRQLRGRIIR